MTFPVRVGLVGSSRTSSRLISKSTSQLALPTRISLLPLWLHDNSSFTMKDLYSSSHHWAICPELPYNDLLTISTPSFDSFLIQNNTWILSGFGSLVRFSPLDLLLVTACRIYYLKKLLICTRVHSSSIIFNLQQPPSKNFCFVLVIELFESRNCVD